jgi:hypothetical protein
MFIASLLPRRVFLGLSLIVSSCFITNSCTTASQSTSKEVRQHETKSTAKFTAHRSTQPRIEVIAEDFQMDAESNVKIKRGVNFLYNFYETKFAYTFSPDLLVKIRVFEDINAYKKYVRKASPSTTGSNIGLYIHSLKEAVVWKNKNEDQFLSTLFHETSHLLLRSNAENCPKWINEGLSEYFENMDVSGKEVYIKPQIIKDEKTKKWLATGKMPDLQAYLGKYNEEWDKENNLSDQPRALAWSMVYFLMSNDEGQAFIKDCLHYFYKKQTDKLASVRAIDTYYPGQHAKFEKDWKNWIPAERQNQILVIERPKPEAKAAKKPDLMKKMLSILK